MPEKFNLVKYVPDILKMSKANIGMTPEVALQCFIANLSTMKEHYPGCPSVDFRAEGQRWNSLLSAERVAQREEARSLLRPSKASTTKKI